MVGRRAEMVAVAHANKRNAVFLRTCNRLLCRHRSRFESKPAAGVELSVIPGGNRYRDELGEIKATTDAEGKVSITWPDAGMYWLEAELKTSEGASKPATERRASYSATLEVLPQ